MTRYKTLTNLTQYPLPARPEQRRRTTLFSNAPGDTIAPYPFWMQNVIPTPKGVKSISWVEGPKVTDAQESGVPSHVYYFPTEGSGFQQLIFTNNNLYLFIPKSSEWKKVAHYEHNDEKRIPTYAYIRQDSYVWVQESGLKKIEKLDATDVTLTWGSGVTAPTDILGCSECSGYLLLFSKDRVYYSSPLNPTAFEISDSKGVSTGAGSTAIQGLLGDILTILPIAGGAIIYTNQCAFSMRYTGNPLVPFIFTQIENCPGVIRQWHIATTKSGASHTAWTTAGLQNITNGKASNILEEFSNVLARSALIYYESYNVYEVPTPKDLKLQLIEDGILIVSVGANGSNFEYAWYYDLDLNRWGRLSMKHWHIGAKIPVVGSNRRTWKELLESKVILKNLVFQAYASLLGDRLYSSQRPLRVMYYGVDGKYYDSDFSIRSVNADSLVAIGEYRITFGKRVELNELQIRAETEHKVSITAIAETGGVRYYTTFVEDTSQAGRYVERVEGESVIVEISGDFELSDVEASLVLGGIR